MFWNYKKTISAKLWAAANYPSDVRHVPRNPPYLLAGRSVDWDGYNEAKGVRGATHYVFQYERCTCMQEVTKLVVG